MQELKKWFGHVKFNFTILHSTSTECIFVTFSELNDVGIYRAKVDGDVVKILHDLEYKVNFESSASVLGMIEDVVRTYGAITKKND